jgi:hypothetical protein
MWHCEVLSWCCGAESRVVRRNRFAAFATGSSTDWMDPGNVTYRMARATEFFFLVILWQLLWMNGSRCKEVVRILRLYLAGCLGEASWQGERL